MILAARRLSLKSGADMTIAFLGKPWSKPGIRGGCGGFFDFLFCFFIGVACAIEASPRPSQRAGYKSLVRVPRLEPEVLRRGIFLPSTAFAALACTSVHSVWGLDYSFSVARAVGAARLVSIPFAPIVRSVRLAPGLPVTGFPEFRQFCSPRFHEGTP